MDTLEVRDGYARPRKRLPNPTVKVRRMTLEEVKALRPGQRVDFIANDGQLRQLTINGNVQTWKRDAQRVEVPVKYGMYEYARLDTAEALQRLVVRVEL